ncbi:MAG: ABC transporter permease, partial [Planctomycetes bacterium]|nr:ABC transporter permease [Planctomycetota bacterium]
MNRIWAVARNLFREVLRMRALIVFLGFVTALYTLGFAWWLHRSTGLADEKVQTFLSYSLSLATILLSFVVIFVSIATITGDIKRKEIFTIATKPISRADFLLGKLLGMALLNFLLLAITGGIIYGVTLILAHDKDNTQDERRRIRELVLIARKSVKPPLPDVRKQAKEETEKFIKEYIRKENITDPVQIDARRRGVLKEKIEDLTRKLVSAIPPGGHKVWHFTGIEPTDRENGYIFIRYKQEVS